jgi:hypothetical protein
MKRVWRLSVKPCLIEQLKRQPRATIINNTSV